MQLDFSDLLTVEIYLNNQCESYDNKTATIQTYTYHDSISSNIEYFLLSEQFCCDVFRAKQFCNEFKLWLRVRPHHHEFLYQCGFIQSLTASTDSSQCNLQDNTSNRQKSKGKSPRSKGKKQLAGTQAKVKVEQGIQKQILPEYLNLKSDRLVLTKSNQNPNRYTIMQENSSEKPKAKDCNQTLPSMPKSKRRDSRVLNDQNCSQSSMNISRVKPESDPIAAKTTNQKRQQKRYESIEESKYELSKFKDIDNDWSKVNQSNQKIQVKSDVQNLNRRKQKEDVKLQRKLKANSLSNSSSSDSEEHEKHQQKNRRSGLKDILFSESESQLSNSHRSFKAYPLKVQNPGSQLSQNAGFKGSKKRAESKTVGKRDMVEKPPLDQDLAEDSTPFFCFSQKQAQKALTLKQPKTERTTNIADEKMFKIPGQLELIEKFKKYVFKDENEVNDKLVSALNSHHLGGQNHCKSTWTPKYLTVKCYKCKEFSLWFNFKEDNKGQKYDISHFRNIKVSHNLPVH
eukprot:403332299